MSSVNNITDLAMNQSGFDWKFILSIIGLYLVILGFCYPRLFEDKTTREHIIQSIENKRWIIFYRQLVNGLLHRLQVWFGPALSWEALLFCFALAYFYPLIFFVWAYSWGNGLHDFLGLAIFDRDTPYRFWYLPSTIACFIVLVVLNKVSGHIDSAAKHLFLNWLGEKLGGHGYRIVCAFLSALLIVILLRNIGWIGELYYWIVGLYLFLGYFITVHLVVAAITLVFGNFVLSSIFIDISASDALVIVLVSVYFVFLAVSAIEVGAGFVTAMIFVIGALAVSSFNHGDYHASLFIFVLFVMLPVLNGCLDWLSWACSRYFLKRASREDGVLPIIRDISIDLVLAVFFMMIMCLIIPAGAETLNLLYGHYKSNVQFEWRSLALGARNDPWGEGLMVTMMVLSTLIPTLIHIVLACVALILQSFMGLPVVGLLKQYDAKPSHLYLFKATGLVTAYIVGIVVIFYLLYRLMQVNVAEKLYSLTILVWG